jgi:hypothetical protein
MEDMNPQGRPLVISSLPANSVRLGRYRFEQRGAKGSPCFIKRKCFEKTVDRWIFSGRLKYLAKRSAAFDAIVKSLPYLEKSEWYRGYVVAAVRVREVKYEEACRIRDKLCKGVEIRDDVEQILFYEKVIRLEPPVRVDYDKKLRYDRTLPMPELLEAKCRTSLKKALGTSIHIYKDRKVQI